MQDKKIDQVVFPDNQYKYNLIVFPVKYPYRPTVLCVYMSYSYHYFTKWQISTKLGRIAISMETVQSWDLIILGPHCVWCSKSQQGLKNITLCQSAFDHQTAIRASASSSGQNTQRKRRQESPRDLHTIGITWPSTVIQGARHWTLIRGMVKFGRYSMHHDIKTYGGVKI
jgi:hypothetical protein